MAHKKGVAHCEILYFPVKQGVAHEQETILMLKSRGWPTGIFYFPVKQGVAHCEIFY